MRILFACLLIVLILPSVSSADPEPKIMHIKTISWPGLTGFWDSPFLNFREYGENEVEGRFIFDPGIRIYPEMVPGMAIDPGFIGDSEFEFSFGISYVASF